jgi:outer membrane usher protein
VDDRGERFPVALHGAVYLTGITGPVRLRVTWRDQQCAIDVAAAATRDPLPDLGTHACRGVAR